MLRMIAGLLRQKGYRPIDGDNNLLWLKAFGNEYGLIRLIPKRLPGQQEVSVNSVRESFQRQENALMIRLGKPVNSLLLVLTDDLPSSSTAHEVSTMNNAWIVDCLDAKLMIYENQEDDFYGLREDLERLLETGKEEERLRKRRERQEFITPVNTTVILINVLVFISLSMIGSTTDPLFMAEHGALTWYHVMERGELWRLLTSGFLHFGAEHLFHNMLGLLVIGSRLEKLKGRFCYLLIYMASEIVSAVTSLMITLSDSTFSVSAGASGAVFGVIGALLAISLFDALFRGEGRGKIGRISFLFMLGFAFVGGVASPEVDRAAHLGGLLTGFILMSIILLAEKAAAKERS